MKLASLRERRLECGLTQGELAARAGVSRQLVAAVESGRNTPAVDAAIAVARVLGTTAEELFADEPAPVVAALENSLDDGSGVRVGRVGDQLVYAELADHGVCGAGWASPDGVLVGGRLRLFPGTAPRGLVVAGCDPALGVAERLLGGLGARSLLAISAPTGAALRALRSGSIHAAVVHGMEPELPEPPVDVLRWHLTSWQVGLGRADQWHGNSLESLLDQHVPIAQRDPAAASQQAFDRARVAVGVASSPTGPRAGGHLDAARIAAAMHGAGVTTEGAARAFDLDFLALEHHVVEVWIDQRWAEHPGVGALGELLASRAFTERVAHFGGYDMSRCGERIGP